MKNVLLLAFLCFFLSCQNESPAADPVKMPIIKDSNIVRRDAVNPYVQVDVSPMDVTYLPADYPVKKMNGEVTTPPVARVIYSRPHRQGRQIFGNIVKWGEPWRLGANEATEIQFFQPVTIGGKRLDKGQYILYAIPHEDRWTIVFNANLYTWGLTFNLAKDVLKLDVPVQKKTTMVENFSMVFTNTATGADLVMAWENREARLPIQF